MSKMSSKWAHWTQSKLCLVTQLFPFPEEKEIQRPAVEKKKNGTYFLPCGQWLNCRGTGEANIRGRPLDFWGRRRGGGVWVISVKNILQTDFEGKNILWGDNWGKKYPALKKKYLSWHINYAGKKNRTPLYVRGKKFQRFGKKITYPNQITYTPLRSQIVNPWVLGLCHSLLFSSF